MFLVGCFFSANETKVQESETDILFHENIVSVISLTKRDEAKQAPKSQDVMTFKPAPVKIITDVKTMKILKESDLYPIIEILRKGPMTVRELEKAYAEYAAECGGVQPKSDKTIYRYLKVLEEAGLVVPAGQRVIIGKTATEVLFSRAARIFDIREEPTWKPEEAEEVARRISLLLGKLYGKECSVKCLQEFLSELERARQTQLDELYAKADEKSLELLTAGEWKIIGKVFDHVGKLGALLKHPDLIEQLRHCFG